MHLNCDFATLPAEVVKQFDHPVLSRGEASASLSNFSAKRECGLGRRCYPSLCEMASAPIRQRGRAAERRLVFAPRYNQLIAEFGVKTKGSPPGAARSRISWSCAAIYAGTSRDAGTLATRRRASALPGNVGSWRCDQTRTSE